MLRFSEPMVAFGVFYNWRIGYISKGSETTSHHCRIYIYNFHCKIRLTGSKQAYHEFCEFLLTFKAMMEDDQWRIVCLVGTGTYLYTIATRQRGTANIHAPKEGLQYSHFLISQCDFFSSRLRVGSGPSFPRRPFSLSAFLTVARLDAQTVPAWLMGPVLSGHLIL